MMMGEQRVANEINEIRYVRIFSKYTSILRFYQIRDQSKKGKTNFKYFNCAIHFTKFVIKV